MDCRDKFPGEILPSPIFPDGRGELIDILLPGLECEVKSYFLPEDLDLRGIKLNKNPVECLKPQKSKPGSQSTNPNAPTNPTEYWYLIDPGWYSLAVAFPEYTGYTSSTMDADASIWRKGPYRMDTAVVYYANILIRENQKLLIEESRHTDIFGYYFTLWLYLVSETGFKIAIYYSSTNDPIWRNAVIYQPYSFPLGYRIRTWKEDTVYRILINGSEIELSQSTPEIPKINDGDNGMKDNCCDCIEAMAALMEAYLEKVEKLIIESENRQIEHANQTAAQICKFFTAQLKAFDIVDDERILKRLDELENNIWTGGSLEQLERSRE